MCTRHIITTAGKQLRPCAVGWRLTCQPSTSHLSMGTAQGQTGTWDSHAGTPAGFLTEGSCFVAMCQAGQPHGCAPVVPIRSAIPGGPAAAIPVPPHTIPAAWRLRVSSMPLAQQATMQKCSRSCSADRAQAQACGQPPGATPGTAELSGPGCSYCWPCGVLQHLPGHAHLVESC